MSTTATERVTVQVIADLDVDAPAKPVRHHTPVREPDFYDDGMAYWIGEDAAIGCDLTDLAGFGDALELGGWYARTGHWPDEYGIAVHPYTLVTAEGAPLTRHGVEYKVWSYAQHTCLQDT